MPIDCGVTFQDQFYFPSVGWNNVCNVTERQYQNTGCRKPTVTRHKNTATFERTLAPLAPLKVNVRISISIFVTI